ncbi:MAG: glycosyltransferase [Frankia sp.]
MDRQLVQNRWVRRLFPPLASLDFGGTPVAGPVSVVVPARDEERCIARCLNSVVGRGFDNIIVIDTGSVDSTVSIVEGYRQRGVQLIRMPWPDSFAEVRNFAIDTIESGWIVFLDADEWLADRSADHLTHCLASLSTIQNPERLAFAPIIHNPDSGLGSEDLPRIFRADGGIRYQGPVHEYPMLRGTADEPPDLVGLDIWFHHDGYIPAVAVAKNKMARNLGLLRAALDGDPGNPRWLYYIVRDGLPTLNRTQLIDACTILRDFAERNAPTGDRRGAVEYYRLTLSEACQGLGVLGDWDTVYRYCDELDRIEQRDGVDAHYYRCVGEILGGVPSERDLLRTIRLRRDGEAVSASAINSSGRHLDALITDLLARFRGARAAEDYRALCEPWTDVFFKGSVLRQGATARTAAVRSLAGPPRST